jgi:hypothetical protein
MKHHYKQMQRDFIQILNCTPLEAVFRCRNVSNAAMLFHGLGSFCQLLTPRYPNNIAVTNNPIVFHHTVEPQVTMPSSKTKAHIPKSTTLQGTGSDRIGIGANPLRCA